MTLTPQWLDELRARISLSGVIGRTTRLTKAGHEFKACCPFHNEKSPSFTVNDSKGFYHCFGCGAHGDVIRWMTDQRGLAFMDAIKELAAEAGLDLPEPDPRAAKAAEQRGTLYDVMAAAQAFFVEQLAQPEGSKARAYLASRGFDAHTCQRFGFGYAPEGRQALRAALSQFPEALLIEAGLRIAVEDKEPYDRFRGRLMLPIEDARGRVIAFGGRILEAGKTDAPKYLNSPDTPLFDKGRTLYNLHRAGPASRQTGRLIVVEGYMDVIALAAAGIADAVAPLGTALTETQIELLWRQVETPVLCFDGDAAGQRAAMRAVTRALPILKPSHSLRIVTLPLGMDPDDIVKRSGADGMAYQLEHESKTLLEHLWFHERNAVPLNTPEEKAGLMARLEAHVELITHPDIRQLYKSALRSEFFRFAYPRRDPAQAQQDLAAAIDPGVKRWRGIAKLPLNEFDGYMKQRLGAAIARGLTIWPDQVSAFAAELGKAADLDPRIEVMIDEMDSKSAFNSANFAIAFFERGLKPPSPEEFGFLKFPFAWPMFEREYAISTLRKAIDFYILLPKIEESLNLAQANYERAFIGESDDIAEFARAEVERLRALQSDKRTKARAFAAEFEPA